MDEEIKMLRQELELMKETQQNLVNFNTKLPNDINKYFKMLKNQVEDLQDQVDRIEEIVDVKITSKQEMNRVKIRVRNLEEGLSYTKSKCLDIEDHLVSVEKTIYKNMTQCEAQYQELLSEIPNKLQSQINNTKYSIQKLLNKKHDHILTEKEEKRLETKKLLLEQLLK